MAKRRDTGDADASGDFGTEPSAGEPEFGSAEWLLAQLNGGRVPADAPRSPLLPPQQPVVEPAAEPAVERAAEAVEAPRGPLLPPQQPVAAPAEEWRNPLVAPRQPVPADAADAAPERFEAVQGEQSAEDDPAATERASGVESLAEAWASAPPPAAPLVPPAAQAYVPPTIDSSLEELFGPPAVEPQVDAAPFVPPSPPVVPAVAEAQPSEAPAVAPGVPTAATPPAPPVAASDDNDFFAPPRSAQPDFFELAFAPPIAEPVVEPVVEPQPVDESVVAEQAVNEPPATAVLPVFAPPAAELAPEVVAPVAPPIPERPFEQQPPILVAPQQPVQEAPETSVAPMAPVAAAADLSFTSAILTPVDEIEQLFGTQPGNDSGGFDDDVPSGNTAPAFSWGLTAGGNAAAAPAATASAAAASAASDAEPSAPTPAEPVVEQPEPSAPVFAEVLPAEADFTEAPAGEFAADPQVEAVVEPVVADAAGDAERIAAEPFAAEPAAAEPAAAEPAAAEPLGAEPIVAWADVVLTPPAQPDASDDAVDSLFGTPIESNAGEAALLASSDSAPAADTEAAAAAEPVADSAAIFDASAAAPAATAAEGEGVPAQVDAFAFAAPAAVAEAVSPAEEPVEESTEEPEATSDDALADWFAASLAAASTDETPRAASSASEQPSDIDFDAMLADDDDNAGDTDAAAPTDAEASATPFAAPFAAAPAPAPDAFAAPVSEGTDGPPPLIAPPAQSEAPLVVPPVAAAAASAAANPFGASRPQATAAATTPFGGLEPAASAGAPGSPIVPGSGSGATAGGGSKKPPRALIITLIAMVAVAVLVGLYFVGTQLPTWFGSAPAPVASETPSAEPTAETPEPVIPTAMQPPGEHSWDSLFGGECLDPFTSPWEETFTVVDCAAPHAAQLVYRGSFGGESSTLFPGEEALAGQINSLCSVPGIVDLAAASSVGELQLIGSYPVTAEQWESGQQNYYCFINQVNGEPITGSLAGPGPAV